MQCLNCTCNGDDLGSCSRFYQSVSNDITEMADNPPFSSQDTAKERKATPVFSGVLKYFPNALKEVSKCSQAGNDQHHPNTPLHWDMEKSKDELDALTRHLIDHSIEPLDEDGQLHLAKVAWRALAALERYLRGEDI
jgi:hypothetical protein